MPRPRRRVRPSAEVRSSVWVTTANLLLLLFLLFATEEIVARALQALL